MNKKILIVGKGSVFNSVEFKEILKENIIEVNMSNIAKPIDIAKNTHFNECDVLEFKHKSKYHK